MVGGGGCDEAEVKERQVAKSEERRAATWETHQAPWTSLASACAAKKANPCVENDVSAGKSDLWVRVQKRQAGCRLSQWPWRVAASVEVPLDGRAHRKAGQLLYSI